MESNTVSNTPLIPSFKSIWNYLLKIIADLRLAIILLLAIAIFSITGTIIEQGQSEEFYLANYPEDPALFGFLTGKLLLAMGFNHVYSTWWFLSILALFGSSLIACTFKRQLPALKAAQKWQFYTKPRQFSKLALSSTLKSGNLEILLSNLQKRGYKVFLSDNALYARKGIIGKIGPIIVHIGMIVILLGAIWGAFTGFIAQEVVASGDTFQISNIYEAGIFADSQIPKDWSVKVNRFWIDYTPQGNIDQFYSDLSVIDQKGKELDRDTIYVNKPLRYRGVTLYQTNWGIAGVKVQFNNSPVFSLPMAEIPTEGQGKIWGSWIPTKPDLSEGVSLLAKDLQGTMLVYDVKGELIGAVREGMSIPVNGINLKVVELIGSTGLQIKADPGIPIVYTGFALLMVGVVMSYFSHSQIWALQEDNNFYLGGKTNRAQVTFERELVAIIDELDS